jgi:acetyl esterase/lipase
MPVRGALALLLLLMPLAAAGQIPIAPETISSDSYPAHIARFPGGVTGFPDLVYAGYSGYRPLTLDLYLPPGGKLKPLVLYVHGGGLRASNARHAIGIPDFPAVLARLAARGYAVASVNYRLSSEARFPAQVQDVKAAIVYLRANAGKYRIDPARALVWGGSSGGELAGLVAASCGKPEFQPRVARGAPVSDCVQGAVIWYGDLDLAMEAPDPATNAFLGCDPCSAAQLASASPIAFVTPATVPMLLVHGAEDAAVPLAVPQAMARKLTQQGVPVETLFIPGVGHGFVGKTPAQTKAANDQALTRSFAYIDKLLSPARVSAGKK